MTTEGRALSQDDMDLGPMVRSLAVGQRILTRYRLEKLLGRGGMAVVWLAHDEHLDRKVALKFLPETLLHDPVAIDDLKRETRKSLELTHHHIVRIYDFIESSEYVAISMEAVNGGTLATRRLQRPHRVFEIEEIKAWIVQLCDALSYAHEKIKLVHRDLKPSNLMVNSKGELKLADFGIARSMSDTLNRITVHRATSGTLVYMSPQQMAGDPTKVTDDIYGLGATLYDLLTSKPPFHSGNIVHQLMEKIPPSMAQRRQELGIAGAPISKAWEETVAACLAKYPEDRPQGIREVAAKLGVTVAFEVLPATDAVDSREMQDAATAPSFSSHVGGMDTETVPENASPPFAVNHPDFKAYLEMTSTGNHAEALKWIKKVVRDMPDCPEALVALGNTYVHLKFYEDAVNAYQQATEYKPEYTMAWYALAEAYTKQGKLENAISAHEQAVMFKSNDAEAWCRLGIAYRERAKYDNAIESFGHAIKLRQDLTLAWHSLAECHHKQGRFEEELSAYQQAVKYRPDHAESWCRLGVAYQQQGHYEDAINSYQQAIEIKPDCTRAWHSLGETYRKLGKYDEEVNAYQQAVKFKTDDADAWCRLALVYRERGKYNDEMKAYQQAVEYKPNDAEAWHRLGVACRGRGQYVEAVRAFQQTVKLKPDDAGAWHMLGRVAHNAGRHREAHAALDRLRKLDPERADDLQRSLW
ncbi:MAG: tetratricopeptide repeat protein [Verrucomicrobia bacterium]|nr:tetratricopeptide repeat protein [Verrucomicrobiota bacterium]